SCSSCPARARAWARRSWPIRACAAWCSPAPPTWRASSSAPSPPASTPAGRAVPLVAETGGQNAMIVDSSALSEQVVADATVSAFDSAGQRCSALRVLCLQDDIAESVLAMLKGALHELVLGDPRRLSTDIGPVIDAEARATLSAH